jgi:tetrachlorobenzoquinone reductase
MVSSDRRRGDLRVRLTGISYGAQGINVYRLTSADGQALPPFEPGAHIDIHIDGETTRQYSLLWPAPSREHYLLAVQLADSGRGGSQALHRKSVVGELYDISMPRNHFALTDEPLRCRLFAGGIGITPIVSMFRRLKSLGRAVELFYWTACPERTLFLDELKTDPDVRIFHASSSVPPRVRVGDIIKDTPGNVRLYCCGPHSMLADFDQATGDRPAGLAHRERFTAVTDANALETDSFQVRLERSGQTVIVQASESLLDVCRAAGIDVAYSCEEGVCGACEVRVLAGEVMHRDSVLTPAHHARSDTMMICCSRGKGASLVLDL